MISSEKVFRFNGDQFIIICEDYTQQQAKEIFYQIKKMVKNIGKHMEPAVTLNITAGAVRYPDNGSTKEELLSNLETFIRTCENQTSWRNYLLFSRYCEITSTYFKY